jgi:copper(I)-binding protein
MNGKAMVLGAVLCLAAGGAWAGDATVGDLAVQGAFARATPGAARNGGAFMTIVNKGGQADTLIAASAPVAPTAELHTHIKDGDVMKMRAVEAIEVPAGGTVKLEPGGLHVMFMGLNAPLKEGQTFPLKLKFAKAGEVEVTVDVKGVGAMGMGAMDHSRMPMDHMQHGRK